MLNHIVIMGRLARDPELEHCPATAARVAELFAQNADTLN